ncbi:cytochrome P450 87A3-like [Mangifera indica]|uniref:cytochrome P450 87A3-like n=1 Tax=Mangifera indica TaxID=29780 RepID=UPI001CF98BCB|nr:cytochrome P450 87A3-like [Mangifera indica]
MWSEIGLCVVAFLVIKISHWFYTWSNPKCDGKLPPGSMGLPIIGETLQFLSPYKVHDVAPFLKRRMARYGPLFRTSLFGQKMIVSTDPETNYTILQRESTNFSIWLTDSFSEFLGEENMLTQHGTFHRYMKNLILHLVGPESLRGKLLHQMDEATSRHIRSWASQGNVNVKEGIAEMIFESFAKRLISYDEKKIGKKLLDNYKAFMNGLISLPINIPGTAFHACVQGSKNALKVIREIYYERKATKIAQNDFLDRVIEEVEKENAFLDDGVAINMLFLLLFGAFESTSEAITLLTKFISDHPRVLEELMKEHEAILKGRADENSGLTWEEYKSMTFTHMVINETVRLANIAPVIFRKVGKDAEIKGYTIPKGWIVMVAPAVVHLNPEKYENPLEFNPWRWKGQDLHSGSKTFMAWGSGTRLCVGADFAKLQIAIFLHHFVSRYRWTVTKGGDFIRRPSLIFPNGLHIQIEEKQQI